MAAWQQCPAAWEAGRAAQVHCAWQRAQQPHAQPTPAGSRAAVRLAARAAQAPPRPLAEQPVEPASADALQDAHTLVVPPGQRNTRQAQARSSWHPVRTMHLVSPGT